MHIKRGHSEQGNFQCSFSSLATLDFLALFYSLRIMKLGLTSVILSIALAVSATPSCTCPCSAPPSNEPIKRIISLGAEGGESVGAAYCRILFC